MKIPESLRPKIADLFKQMDKAYEEAAQKSGFECNGCQDNCCLTRFFHHTLLEYLYLREGLQELTPEQMDRVQTQAKSVGDQTAALEPSEKPIRIMCPLNEQGRCILYAHRPMICRLHGIAYSLRRPDGQTHTGPGCDDFDLQCQPSRVSPLDRTPIYIAMANLERELREALGFKEKIKMTIAEMIIHKIDL